MGKTYYNHLWGKYYFWFYRYVCEKVNAAFLTVKLNTKAGMNYELNTFEK